MKFSIARLGEIHRKNYALPCPRGTFSKDNLKGLSLLNETWGNNASTNSSFSFLLFLPFLSPPLNPNIFRSTCGQAQHPPTMSAVFCNNPDLC